MELRVLCVGDVVGMPGRTALKEGLERIIVERRVGCVIVNAENAAAGSGLIPAQYDKINGCGADVITLGDHVYRRAEIIPTLQKSDRIVRPANLPPGAPGKEFVIHRTADGHQVAVMIVLGRLFMRMPTLDCPFRTVDRVLGSLPQGVRVVVVEMHAEATSEKMAMGWHLDGRATLVFGTHTHTPTADARILPKGTGYITDIGMTGPYDSILGRDKQRVLGTMISGVPSKFDVAEGDPRMCGVLATVDTETGRTLAIERIEHCVR